ncbi:1-deoxy-D-xylulose-5-phosphate reductoisomerase [Candidatus Peregrinibacteria bacterium]|nr:1-deoxy-D-xylulose-5-phosphate reductoisomerase [Candidatus Peregrinibacteria bacterium]
MKKIIILGSTGSIGTQTLDVIRANPDEIQVLGLSAHENTDLFERQVREFRPKYVVQTSFSENPQEALMSLAQTADADLIVNALTGSAGLMPTYAAVKVGKTIALANKESLVMAGELIIKLAGETGAQILPIDSEMNAIWQMIGNKHSNLEKRGLGLVGSQSERTKGRGEPANAGLEGGNRRFPHKQNIEKIILTASGGPFWKWKREELEKVTAAQAIKHPTWKMGEKVSIDSATLMNKAFEIIETRWLFDIPAEKIEAVIHRQSIVHSFVQFIDGNTAAILSQPDMRIPISHALFYPARAKRAPSHLDVTQQTLTFEKPDFSLFEGPKLAYEVLQAGGILPAVFCMADEIAVKKFIAGEISFLGMYDFIKRALSKIQNAPLSLEALRELSLQI